MTDTNINDAAGVAALLNQLKASPQWQEIAAGMVDQPDSSTKPRIDDSRSETGPSVIEDNNESVASLLSQLEFPGINRSVGPSKSASIVAVRAETRPEENRRSLSFRAALPILSELAEDESFVHGVKKIKAEQDSLERELWAEREAIYSKYEEKFKTAQTKAQMIGATISQYEIDTMKGSFNKEIQNFDNGRAILAWENLVSKQQQELERMRVPTMFHTSVAQDRERQQRIIEVLETVAETI